MTLTVYGQHQRTSNSNAVSTLPTRLPTEFGKTLLPIDIFIESVPDAMIAVDADGCIVVANTQADVLFAPLRGTLVGRAVETLIPPRLQIAHRRHFGSYLTAPKVRVISAERHLYGVHSDGREFPVEISLSPIFAGKAMFTLAVIRDITKRLEGNATLRRNEQLLRSLVGGVLDYAIYLLDASGRVQTWNSGAEIMTGYKAEEIIGSDVSILSTVTDRGANAPHRALECARHEGRFEAETWKVRKDGRQFLAHVTIDAIRDGNGTLSGFAKITRDITAVKRAEQAEREKQQLTDEVQRQRMISEERDRASRVHQKTNKILNAIIASSPLGISTVSADGVVESWNPACERIYGYDAAEVLGRQHREFFEKLIIKQDAAPDPLWPPGLAAGESGQREVLRRRKDGTVAVLSIARATLYDADEVLLGWIYIINDVTQRKAIEEQLQQSQKMEAMGQMTAGVAHDFNNLLTIISGNLEFMIEEASPDSEARSHGRLALQASLRGAELIQQLLAFSRKQRLEPRIVQVNDLIAGMTNMLRRSLGEQLQINLRAAPDAWPIELDPARLQTAIANLAMNARDAMPGGGSVFIETANVVLDDDYAGQFPDVLPGDYVLISVSDSGCGMPPEVLARAFDPFFTTKPPGHGTGLGLSMVFGFVKQSNGHIRIYSEQGHGTTVKLYLPRAKSVHAPPQVVKSNPSPTLSGRILVVEDNVDLARVVEGMLRGAGFSVIVAHDARAALEMLDSETQFDLLFTDLILANGMNGIELASAVHQRRPGLRILFTSGFAEPALTVEGKATVADRMLCKPYKKADLLAKIARSMEAEAVS